MVAAIEADTDRLALAPASPRGDAGDALATGWPCVAARASRRAAPPNPARSTVGRRPEPGGPVAARAGTVLARVARGAPHGSARGSGDAGPPAGKPSCAPSSARARNRSIASQTSTNRV